METHLQIGATNSTFTFSEPRVSQQQLQYYNNNHNNNNKVHAFVYEPVTGEAQKLPVDFGAVIIIVVIIIDGIIYLLLIFCYNNKIIIIYIYIFHTLYWW